MYAIVEIAGQQFKVEEGKKIFVHRLEVEDGKNVEFDHVLLIENDGKVTIGEPIIKDASVEGKILQKLKGDKVIVFKKKRKKGYRIRNGHRQYLTQIEIVSINEKPTVKKVVAKNEGAVVTEVNADMKLQTEEKGAVKKVAPKKATVKSATVKKTTTKKTSKKPVVKKTTAKKPAKGKAE